MVTPCKDQLIADLQLEPHIEGGYFRRTFCSQRHSQIDNIGNRPLMTSIYYLLTDDRPVGYLHRNQSDIIHYWHCGHPLNYWLINEDGLMRQQTLGPDLTAGHQLQLFVPGGVWKATELMAGEYGLVSEAVCPGFDFNDMQLASAQFAASQWPTLWPGLQRFCPSM